MPLNPYVWFPHFKFMLQTISVQYPRKPNEVTKKKYYEFINNIPVFLPMKPLGKTFTIMLNKYPVTPYLDSRMSFMKWCHYIISKINEILELPEQDFYKSLEEYYKEYKPKEELEKIEKDKQRKYIEIGIIVTIILGIYLKYNR
tara:strand:- start:49 stop:480 length:432 start_codon:yes stop_codon:yes gene_type:complete